MACSPYSCALSYAPCEQEASAVCFLASRKIELLSASCRGMLGTQPQGSEGPGHT